MTRPHPPRDTRAEREVVDSLLVAIASGDTDRVLACVAPDVVCVSDGGPDRQAARRPVVGSQRVARLMINLARRYAGTISVEAIEVNGDFGVVLSIDGEVEQVMTFEVEHERVVPHPDRPQPRQAGEARPPPGDRLSTAHRACGPRSWAEPGRFPLGAHVRTRTEILVDVGFRAT